MISFARGLQLDHSTLFSVHDVSVSELFWWVLMSSWMFPSRANRMVSMPYTLLLLTAILMWWSTSFHDLGSTGLTRTIQAEHVWTWLLEDEKRNMILEYLQQEGAVTMWSKAGSVQVPYNKYSDQTGNGSDQHEHTWCNKPATQQRLTSLSTHTDICIFH